MLRLTLLFSLIAPMLIAQALLPSAPLVDDGPCALATMQREDAPARMTISYALLETVLASEAASDEQIAHVQELSWTYAHAIEAAHIPGVRAVTSSRWWNELGVGGCEDFFASVDGEPDPDAFTLEVTKTYAFGDGAVAAFLDRTFVESGEITIFFTVLVPDDSGELKVDYFHQHAEFNDLRSAEGLDGDDGYVLPTPWAEIQKHGLPELPTGTTVTSKLGEGACVAATPTDHPVPGHQLTISYALFEDILAHEEAATFLDEPTFAGPGELTAFFTVLTSDDVGGHKIVDVFGVLRPDDFDGSKILDVTQRPEFDYLDSIEGLEIDKHGMISMPVAMIGEHGLPEFPADSTFVTLTCS